MLHKMLDTTMLKHTMLHTNTCVTYNMTCQRLWFVVQCGVGEIQSWYSVVCQMVLFVKNYSSITLSMMLFCIMHPSKIRNSINQRYEGINE